MLDNQIPSRVFCGDWETVYTVVKYGELLASISHSRVSGGHLQSK